MKFVKLLALVAIIFALPKVGASQKFWEIGLATGATTYHGDLTDTPANVRGLRPAFQLSAKRYFDREHALRFNLLHGLILGDDHDFDRNYSRGNAFKGWLTELSVLGELDIFGRKRFTKQMSFQKVSSPYIVAGLGLTYFNPDVTYGEPDSKDAVIDYNKLNIVMPIGAGVKYDVSERVVLGLEVVVRFTFSDYLDGTQASGNAYSNDSYALISITGAYRFFKPVQDVPMSK